MAGPPLGLSLDTFLVLREFAAGVDRDCHGRRRSRRHAHVRSCPTRGSRSSDRGYHLRLAAGARLDDADVGLLSFTVKVTDQLGNSVDFPLNLVVLNVNEAPQAIVLDTDTVVENVAGATIGTLTSS